MINFVPFYKDISTAKIDSKKLKKRVGKVDYKKNLKLLHDSFQLYNQNNNFVVQTDYNTELPYNCYRSDLSNYNLIESLIVSNLNYVKNNIGKSVLVGVDNIVVNNVDNFFNNKFDIGLYCLGTPNKDEKFNLINGVVLVNSTNKNHNMIEKFFYDRHQIYCNYNPSYKTWWGDMLSLNHLVSRKNIVQEFYSSNKNKTVFDFEGLKIKIFEVNKHYYKWVTSEGKYIKSKDDILLDFPGDNSVKRHAEVIYNSLIQNN